MASWNQGAGEGAVEGVLSLVDGVADLFPERSNAMKLI